MIHSVTFICVLDTNVIYPIEIRDLLFWLAHYDLYTPKWSDHIFDEWRAVMIRKGVSEEEADKRVSKANNYIKSICYFRKLQKTKIRANCQYQIPQSSRQLFCMV